MRLCGYVVMCVCRSADASLLHLERSASSPDYLDYHYREREYRRTLFELVGTPLSPRFPCPVFEMTYVCENNETSVR